MTPFMVKPQPCPFCMMGLTEYSVKMLVIKNYVTADAILDSCTKHFRVVEEIREMRENAR